MRGGGFEKTERVSEDGEEVVVVEGGVEEVVEERAGEKLGTSSGARAER